MVCEDQSRDTFQWHIINKHVDIHEQTMDELKCKKRFEHDELDSRNVSIIHK